MDSLTIMLFIICSYLASIIVFFKQKTAYEMRISDWSSDVCSSDLSSVPRVTGSIRRMSERYFGFPALVVEPGVRTGLTVLYDNPKEVGADRIADAVAAFDLYRGPTIVVDLGTATTFEAITSKGDYLENGSAHVRTPVTNTHLVCRYLPE